MIGKICKAITPFFDLNQNRMSYKSRPALVLAKADGDDFIILPISTITKKQNINPIYDVAIDPLKYPKLNLNRLSYVRTHKQTVVHRSSLIGEIGDISNNYQELYLEILLKRENFSNEVTAQALS